MQKIIAKNSTYGGWGAKVLECLTVVCLLPWYDVLELRLLFKSSEEEVIQCNLINYHC